MVAARLAAGYVLAGCETSEVLAVVTGVRAGDLGLAQLRRRHKAAVVRARLQESGLRGPSVRGLAEDVARCSYGGWIPALTYL